jgi:hypothetical protein
MSRRAIFTLAASAFRIENKADVAQLVEQPIRNRQVSGSSPLVGSRIQRLTFSRSRPAEVAQVISFLTGSLGEFLNRNYEFDKQSGKALLEPPYRRTAAVD